MTLKIDDLRSMVISSSSKYISFSFEKIDSEANAQGYMDQTDATELRYSCYMDMATNALSTFDNTIQSKNFYFERPKRILEWMK